MTLRASDDSKPSSLEIARPGQLRDIVASRIREMVISGSVPGGTHLVETDLAALLGVSRQPIREALVTLRSEGWLELIPGRGTFVRTPTPEEVTGMFTVRMALEGEAALCAASNIDEKGVDALRRICQQGRDAFAAKDRDKVVLANARFHSTIAEIAAVRALQEMIQDMEAKVRWHYASIAHFRGEASWNEHDGILDALARRDGEQARLLSRKHIEASRKAYVQGLALASEQSAESAAQAEHATL